MGRTVRIDLEAGVDISDEARTAMIAATMEHLLDEDVSVVRLDGSDWVKSSQRAWMQPSGSWSCSRTGSARS
jgi:hypothetical protein